MDPANIGGETLNPKHKQVMQPTSVTIMHFSFLGYTLMCCCCPCYCCCWVLPRKCYLRIKEKVEEKLDEYRPGVMVDRNGVRESYPPSEAELDLYEKLKDVITHSTPKFSLKQFSKLQLKLHLSNKLILHKYFYIYQVLTNTKLMLLYVSAGYEFLDRVHRPGTDSF